MDITYKHAARVPKDAWYVRLYCWLWVADPDRIDFCRLFWGYFPPFFLGNLLVRIVGYLPWQAAKVVGRGVRAVARKVRGWQPTAQELAEWEAERRRVKVEKRQLHEGHANAFLAWCSRVGDKVVAGCQTVWPVAKWPAYALGIALALGAVGGLGYLIFLLGALAIENAGIVAVVVAVVVGFAAALVSLIAIVAGVDWFFKETTHGRTIRTGVKDGALTFGGAIRTGYGGVKSRTCPKIELVD